jgi:hypothetical protein
MTTKINGHIIGPIAYKPTTKGMFELSIKYKKKAGIDIHIIDKRGFGEHEESALQRISRFNGKVGIYSILNEDKTVCVLSHHVVPFFNIVLV